MEIVVSLLTVSMPFASVLIAGMVCGTVLYILKCHPVWMGNFLHNCAKYFKEVNTPFGSASFRDFADISRIKEDNQDTQSPDTPKKTPKELEALAHKGDAEAQCNLGRMYYFGQGVVQDYEKAVEWWEKAAKQGHALAQFYSGTMYFNGDGVAQDYVRAYAWLNLAAGREKVPKSATEGRDILAKGLNRESLLEAQKLSRTLVKAKGDGG